MVRPKIQRTPTAQLRARGSWRAKLPERAGEPEPMPGAPEAPEFLTDEGMVFWTRMAESNRAAGIESTDWREAMASCCRAWDRFVYYSKRAQEFDGIPTDDLDLNTLRAFERMADAAQSQLMRGLGAFGLTPADRSRITGAVKREPDTKGDKWGFFDKKIEKSA